MRGSLRRSALAAVLSLTVLSAAYADNEADKQAINDLWIDFQTAVVAGDSESFLGLWDAKSIQMMPGIPMRGFEEISDFYSANLSPDAFQAMDIDPVENIIMGDWAYSMGTFTAQSGPANVDGKYSALLRRQADGAWKIYRDMSNSNK
ncbi:MAG: nuclear transport factor 2 family protein [Pseudomonadota bacterium]